jgi:hypothetical protein
VISKVAALPRPYAAGLLMYTRTTSLPSLYIRNIIPDGMDNTPSGAPGPIGVGLCRLSRRRRELRHKGILRSSGPDLYRIELV